MSTIGDPHGSGGTQLLERTEDLSLGIVPCFLTLEPGCMTRQEVAAAYAEKTAVT